MKRYLGIIICVCCIVTGCGKAEEAVISGNDIQLSETMEADAVSGNEISSEEQNQEKEDAEIEDVKDDTRGNITKGMYSGWACGLVQNPDNEDDSDLVVFNPLTMENQKIVTLREISSTQTCAVSSDGKHIAYTDWTNSGNAYEGVYLIVQDLDRGTTLELLKDREQNLLIPYMSWLPDQKRLLCTIRMEKAQNYMDMVCVLDTEEMSLNVLDTGDVWQGNLCLDYSNDIDCAPLNQNKLDALIKKYGGSESIPIEDNRGYNYLEIGMPVLSPDGTKVMYVTDFYRSMAVVEEGEEFGMLCIASGIYMADLKGNAEPELVYANSVYRSTIGKAIWGRNSNEIIFDRFYNPLSYGTSDIVLYNLATKEEETLSAHSDELETQKPRFMAGENQIGICYDGENGDGVYYYDLINKTIMKKNCEYEEQELSLWRFCGIY